MGLIEFFILCVVVVLLAALAVWAIDYFAPGHPALIDKLIWGVAVVVILVALAQSTGLLAHDPQIPRLRGQLKPASASPVGRTTKTFVDDFS